MIISNPTYIKENYYFSPHSEGYRVVSVSQLSNLLALYSPVRSVYQCSTKVYSVSVV